MKLFKRIFVSSALLMAFTASSQAHHSFAMYDRSQVYVLTGVVTSVNPDANHLQLFFARMNDNSDGVVRDLNGEVETWSAEMLGAAASSRLGITSSSFAPGTIFSIAIHPGRNGKEHGVQANSENRKTVIFKCPDKTPPAPSMHCDSVEGSTTHGDGLALPEPTDML